MRLVIVVPTITGREDSLARTLEAYEETLAGIDYTIFTPKDYPSWPAACNHVFTNLPNIHHCDLIHYGADDLVPLNGWFWPAATSLEHNELPAPRVWNFAVDDRRWAPSQENDGPVGALTRFTRVPTLTSEMAVRIGPWPEIIYYADVWVSIKARHEGGWETRVTGGYDFVHHWHQHGRLQDEGEKAHREFVELCARIDP